MSFVVIFCGVMKAVRRKQLKGSPSLLFANKSTIPTANFDDKFTQCKLVYLAQIQGIIAGLIALVHDSLSP